MRKFSIAIGLLSGLLFGLATPLSKMLLIDFNPFQLAGLLYIGAFIFTLPSAVKEVNQIRNKNQTKPQKDIPKIIGVIIFGGFLGPLFLMLGLQTAKALSVSVWLNFELVATAALGVLIFKERLTKSAIFGICLVVISGIVVSVGEPLSALKSGVFIMLACLFWGIDNHLTAGIDEIKSSTVTFIKGGVAGPINLIIGTAMVGYGGLLTIKTIYAIVLGMIAYGLSISLYVTSAQNLGATRSQILFSTGPYWGMLGAVFFIGETFETNSMIAAALLAGGIYLTNKNDHDHRHEHAPLTHIHTHLHLDDHHLHHKQSYPILPHTHEHRHEFLKHQHTHTEDLHHRH